MARRFVEVDPVELYIHPSRPSGADPAKLHRQIALFGRTAVGMPPLVVYEDLEGKLQIWNGITRATRIAKLAPGMLIRVEICGRLRTRFRGLPTVKDVLP